MKSFNHIDRLKNISRMKSETFDLVIIGGGITGAGVARDAAGRGLKVALIEGDDYASGTSSRSSKLIHGGIRYLENMEFHLVFEALSERAKLFHMAPHLVHPLRFVIPLYEGGRVGMFKMGLGMWLYDALSLFRAPELHERLSPTQTSNRLSSLQTEGLKGSYVYSDAYMDDDRLVIETLRSANDLGAVCANYIKATGARFNDKGKVEAVKVKEAFTGEEFEVRGQHVVSTVGVWTDQLGEQLFDKWKSIMRPSKGVHITFSRKRFPLEHAVVMGAESRIVFGIPRNEWVIVGTTDTDFSGDPADVVSTQEDIEYLLKVAHDYFPGAKLTAEDIVSSYAGVRPLVDDGSATEGKTSREHVILSDERNVTFVAGGKYTTYRKMAQDAVDCTLDWLSIETQSQVKKCGTQAPLNPQVTSNNWVELDDMARSVSNQSNLTLEQAYFLVNRHGLEAFDMIKAPLPQGQPPVGESLLWYYELKHALQTTMCLNLRDFVLRRIPLFLTRHDHAQPFYAEWMAVLTEHFGLTQDQVAEQLNNMQRHLDRELGWKSNMLD